MEPPAAGSSDEGLGERELKTAKKKKHGELYEDLLKSFSHMPKLSKKLGHDNLAVVNVAPSVVPNPYLPSFRIFSYNISGTRYVAEDEEVGGGGYRLGDSSCGDGVCSDEGFEKMERRGQASKEWNSSPKSPSRMNRLWTPLGFAQVREIYDEGGWCELMICSTTYLG